MALVDERNSRLDELKTAINQWADKRSAQLKGQVAFSKRVLKGRTGSERLASATVTTASALVVDEIETFLTGE